jgi:ATP-dependent DNA helicase PIF1
MEPPTCRFFFPKPLFDECSPVITMGWLANTDIQPPLTMHPVLSYLGKYVSKPEKSSVSYTELQAHVLPYVNDRAPLLSFVSRILNKLIGERDWSAQEVSHILLRLPVQESSRQVVSLDCRPEEEQSQLVVLDSGEVSAQRSVLQRYCGRLTDSALSTLPSLTLFECLQSWDWIKWKRRPRAKTRVINYFPRYSGDPDSPTFSDYCRVKLMLHHPFIDLADILEVDGTVYGSYIEAFRACNERHSHPQDYYSDLEEDTESDTDSDVEPDYYLDETTPVDFAQRRPNHDLLQVDILETLCHRNIDLQYDWATHIGRCAVWKDIWDQVKAENQTVQVVTADPTPEALNTEQWKLYEAVVSQYTQELSVTQPHPPQSLLNVDGVAGSGKTFTLLKACARLLQLATEAGRNHPVFRAAPTGFAYL